VQQRFEVAVHHSDVRRAIRNGEHNRTGLSDDWAEIRYVEVFAKDSNEAREKISRRYPPHNGWIIGEVITMN